MNDIFESLPTIVKRLPRKKNPYTIYFKLTFNKRGDVIGYTPYIYICKKWHKLDDYKILGIVCKNGDIYLGTI